MLSGSFRPCRRGPGQCVQESTEWTQLEPGQRIQEAFFCYGAGQDDTRRQCFDGASLPGQYFQEAFARAGTGQDNLCFKLFEEASLPRTVRSGSFRPCRHGPRQGVQECAFMQPP